MGFSSRQFHYGFSVTKEMTVEHSWGERVISNFIPTVVGDSLEFCPLRGSLHAANQSLPLGLSAPVAISVSVLGAATTPVSSLLSCSHATMLPRALGGPLYIESIAYWPRVCSELPDQGQVRILAIGTFTLSTNIMKFDSLFIYHLEEYMYSV